MQKPGSAMIFSAVLVSILVLGLNGCGSKGKQGPPGKVAVTITAEAAGANCAEGGRKVDFLDEAGMVMSSMYVCDGTDGESVTVTAEAAGSNCPNAGVKVEYLGMSSYVCNGESGATGAEGSDGADGIGVVVTPIAAGGVCGTVTGINVKLNDGVDTGSNICNGVKGDTGSQGPQGVTGPVGPQGNSVILTPIAAGGVCGAATGVNVKLGNGLDTGSNICNGTNGTNGVSILWLGSTATPPVTCDAGHLDNAYYDTNDFVALICDGGSWVTLAERGPQGIQGNAGVSILWLGSTATPPVTCDAGHLDNAYYDTDDFTALICNGSSWVTLAERGPQGAQGNAGVSILWLGESSGAPVACDSTHLNNAYYDSGDGISYVCDGDSWEVMAQDGSDRLPYVVYSEPADGEDDVRRSISIHVVFNKEMDPATIDGTTFEVTFGGGMYPVTGVVSYGNRVLTFTPHDVLSRLRRYTVVVKAAVEDLNGVSMGHDHAFSFTTDRELWGTAGLIETDNDGNAASPQVAVDPEGNAIAIWEQYAGSEHSIFSNRYDAGLGAWGTAQVIETNAWDAYYPQVAVDPNGNAVAVWIQGSTYSIWSNRYDAVAGAWGTAKLIENGTGDVQAPQVAVDPEGNAVAVWSQFDGTHYSLYSNRYDAGLGAWGTAGLIETNDDYDAQGPQIAVNPEGNTVVVWEQYDGIENSIYSNHYDAGLGAWGTAGLIETNDGLAQGPQVAMDPEGNAIAVWYQNDGTRTNIWSNRYDAGLGAWGTAGLIETDNTGSADYPQVAVDPKGNALAVWSQFDGTRNNVWANRYDFGLGSWGTAGLIETNNAGNAGNPQVAVDPEGNAVAVWSQFDGIRYNIYSNRYDSWLGAWGTAGLIETDNAGSAYYSQVAVDPEGNAIGVWYQSDGTHNNIWANRYD